jgi:hypothetical protein
MEAIYSVEAENFLRTARHYKPFLATAETVLMFSVDCLSTVWWYIMVCVIQSIATGYGLRARRLGFSFRQGKYIFSGLVSTGYRVVIFRK